MARSNEDPTSHPRRRRWRALTFLISLLFVLGWIDRSAVDTVDLSQPTRLLVVSDAGPVDVVDGNVVSLEHRDSWIFSRPRIEVVERDGQAVVRATCPGRFPCRSALMVTTPPGVEVVVVATAGVVQIDGFSGQLTVFSSGDGVLLGSSSGSARVVARNGAVTGFGLAFGQLDVEVENAGVDLSYRVPPESVLIRADDAKVDLSLPQVRYRLSVETSSTQVDVDMRSFEASERAIVVRSTGPVRIAGGLR